MKIIITGHRGYLGRELCKILEKTHEIAGWDVGWFDRHQQPCSDIRNIRPCDLEGIDLVIHLAAVVGEPACQAFRDLAKDINVNATATLAKLCEVQSIPMIFASTCSVYGAADRVLFEDSPVKPLGAYAKDRLLAEQIVLGSVGTALRFGTLFGWSDRMRFDLVVNKWTLEAAQNQSILVEGGKQWRPFTHVIDAAQSVCAIVDLIEAGRMGEVIGEAFNVCTQNVTIIELANMVRQETGCQVEVAANVSDPRNYRVSSDKAQRALGWQPVLSVRDGIRSVYEDIVSSKERSFEAYGSNLRRMELLRPR